MHHSQILDDSSGNPEIIQFYNTTKSGVETFDQKCGVYSYQRRTRRWPEAVFFGMVDMCLVNSWVILKATNFDSKITRRKFVISIGK